MKTWGNTGKSIRIAILDDHAVVRHGLSARLSEESDFEIVGVYASSKEMMSALQSQSVQADIFLIDYSLGESDIDGLNLIRALKIRYPKGKILISSTHDNPATVALAMRAGAKGFVGKSQDLSELIQAIRGVMVGKQYVNEMVKIELSHAATNEDNDTKTETDHKNALTGYYDLSPREREVLRCCLDGLTVTQIANKFARSVKTISGQKQAAFKKLGIRNDSELFKIQNQLKSL